MTRGLNPGEMDREIELQTAAVAQGDSGFPSVDWANATTQTLWAQWLPAGTREAWQAQQRLASYVDGVFRIYDLDTRPTPDLSRVLFEGRLYDIKGVVEIGRRDGLELTVVARGE